MGSNAILEALKGDRFRAKAAFLVGPNIEFFFPAWGRVAARVVPAWLIERLKGFMIWYLRSFRVNEQSDPEQMARYVRTVRAADALRLKLSAQAVLDYTLLPGLETISTPVAVAYADSDTLHGKRHGADNRRRHPERDCGGLSVQYLYAYGCGGCGPGGLSGRVVRLGRTEMGRLNVPRWVKFVGIVLAIGLVAFLALLIGLGWYVKKQMPTPVAGCHLPWRPTTSAITTWPYRWILYFNASRAAIPSPSRPWTK